MARRAMGDSILRTPIWLLGLTLFAVTVAAAMFGAWLSRRADRLPERWGQLTEAQVGYIITSVYTLLGLLVGFTFNMAVDRYQQRRSLVIQDATAIEQLYLRSQLLDEPHRSRFSELMVRYGENHLELARLRREDARAAALIREEDFLLRDLWTATVPAFQSIRAIDFSSSFVDAVNEVFRADAERRAVRQVQIPGAIILLLMIYSIASALVLGAVMRSRKGQVMSVWLIALSTLALMLITDINRPVDGTIRESQQPMEQMLARLRANPPSVFQRLAEPVSSAPVPHPRG